MTDMRQVAAEWLAAKQVIEKFLRECVTFGSGLDIDHASGALIARLAGNDPPILLEMVKDDCCHEPCDCQSIGDIPMELTITDGGCVADFEPSVVLVNGVKFLHSDISKLPPSEVYRIACELAKVQIVNRWEKDTFGRFIRKNQSGREVVSVVKQPSQTWRFRFGDTSQLGEGFASRVAAQAAVDKLLLESGAVVVDPVVETAE